MNKKARGVKLLKLSFKDYSKDGEREKTASTQMLEAVQVLCWCVCIYAVFETALCLSCILLGLFMTLVCLFLSLHLGIN